MKAEYAKKESLINRLRKCRLSLMAVFLMLFVAGSFVCGKTVEVKAEESVGAEETTSVIMSVEPELDEAGVYQIGTATELYWFAGYVNGTETTEKVNATKDAVLTADIIINDVTMLNKDGTLAVADTSTLTTWVPIGNTTSIDGSTYQPNKAYGGTFDGQGHTISGLYYKAIEGTVTGGLFGSVTGTVKRVGLVNSYIESNGDTGGICGYIRGGSVIACYNAATVNGSGICGSICNGTISHCYNAGVIGQNASDRACGISGTTGNGLDLTALLSYCVTETKDTYYSIGKGVTVKEVYGSTAAERLASGEMAYILNGKVSADEEDAVLYWYQNIGEDKTPVLDSTHGKVYVDIACDNNKNLLLYTNTDRMPVHDYTVNGVLCDYCYDIHPDKLSELIKDGVWQIDSVEDLYNFEAYYNNYVCYENAGNTTSLAPVYVDAILLADIDLNVAMVGIDLTKVDTTGALVGSEGTAVDTSLWKEWTPIGKSRGYTGTFDGNGHVITHMFINQPQADSNYWALVRSTDDSAVVRNLGVRDSYICGWNYLGSILAGSGTVTNCFSNAVIVSKSWMYQSSGNSIYAAGIAPNATVSSSYFDGIIYRNWSSSSIGGIHVYPVGATAEDCFSTGMVWSYTGNVAASFSGTYYGTTIVKDEQVSNGSLAHMLQQTYLSGENYWSQGTADYPIPVSGDKIDHSYDEATDKCCCGKYVWDANVTDAYFEDAPELVGGVYQIGNAAELYWFAGLVNGDIRVCKDGVEQNREANAVLTADITVNSGVLNEDGATVVDDTSRFLAWTPIGMYDYSKSINEQYTGTFDGQGHTISGLYLPHNEYYSAGLFGAMNGNGTVKHLMLEDSYFCGNYVGGICGYNEGTVIACYSDVMVAGTTYGGLCGWGSNISYSYYAGKCAYAIGMMNNRSTDHCASNTGLYKGIYSTCSYGYKNCIENIASGTPNCKNGGSSSSSFITYTISTDDIVVSGELAYILNGEVSADAEDATLYWYQNIGTDGAPTLVKSENGMVYAGGACPEATQLKFANEPVVTQHVCSDGYVCDYCYGINADNDFVVDGAWQIGDATGLYAFNKYMNNYSNPTVVNVKLTADIDLNPGMDLTLDSNKKLVTTEGLKEWTPIGTSSKKYAGSFDGQGHVISHLYINKYGNSSNYYYTGLFANCDTTAIICNTGIKDSHIYGYQHVGSFSGNGGTVNNCFSSAIIRASSYVYGIGNATVANSYFNGVIYNGNSNYWHSIGVTVTDSYSTKDMYYYYSGTWREYKSSDSAVEVTADQIADGSLAHVLQSVTDESTWSQSDAGYPVPKAGEKLEHIFTDGSCICGAVAKLSGYTISLGDMIGINFKFTFSDDMAQSGLYVKFTMPDGTVSEEVAVGDADEKGYYTFSCYVAAKEMNKDVTANLYDATDNVLVSDTISVAEYAAVIKADTANTTYTAEDQALVDKMLNYGAFAEVYFEGDTEGTADESVLADAESIVTDLGEECTLDKSEEAETDAVRYAGCSLILLSDTTLRIYFKPMGETVLEDIIFMSGGSELSKGSYQRGDITYYYADVTGIKPDLLSETVAIEASVGGSSYTVALSPMFYVKDMLGGKTTDTALINLLRALYAYHVQAVSYQQ